MRTSPSCGVPVLSAASFKATMAGRLSAGMTLLVGAADDVIDCRGPSIGLLIEVYRNSRSCVKTVTFEPRNAVS